MDTLVMMVFVPKHDLDLKKSIEQLISQIIKIKIIKIIKILLLLFACMEVK